MSKKPMHPITELRLKKCTNINNLLPIIKTHDLKFIKNSRHINHVVKKGFIYCRSYRCIKCNAWIEIYIQANYNNYGLKSKSPHNNYDLLKNKFLFSLYNANEKSKTCEELIMESALE